MADVARVVVVDDDTVIREGLILLLPPGFSVSSYAGVDEFLADQPDAELVLLDLGLRGTRTGDILQGVAGVRHVAANGYLVLVYTNERRREVLACAIANGARGVVHKAESIEALTQAMEAVLSGELWITPALIGLAEVAERRGHLPALSDRQREVLAGRARGETFTKIARRLRISPRTAEEHMAAVNGRFADYLRDHSPADLERLLGLDPPTLID